MKMGAFDRRSAAWLTRGQSSADSRPLRMREASTIATEHSMRWVSSSPLISRLKMATGFSSASATCSAMHSARAVLPIEGRAATTMRLAARKPPVSRSRSSKPVGRPVTSEPCSLAATRRSMLVITSVSVPTKSPRVRFWVRS